MFGTKKKHDVLDPHELDCLLPPPATIRNTHDIDENFRAAMGSLHKLAGKYRSVHSSGYIDEVVLVTGEDPKSKKPLIPAALKGKIAALKPTAVVATLTAHVQALMDAPVQRITTPISPPERTGSWPQVSPPRFES